MTDARQSVDNVATKADLARFIETLSEDLRANREMWENSTLDSYLSALGSWLEDSDAYYRNRGVEPPVAPTWKTFAEMLLAGKIYE